MKAIWNDKVVAESSDIVELEGNAYFPEDAINKKYFKDSNTKTVCPWKGTAQYYSIEVEGKENTDAAWYYADPSKEAENIKGRIAFWNGVEVKD